MRSLRLFNQICTRALRSSLFCMPTLVLKNLCIMNTKRLTKKFIFIKQFVTRAGGFNFYIIYERMQLNAHCADVLYIGIWWSSLSICVVDPVQPIVEKKNPSTIYTHDWHGCKASQYFFALLPT